MLPEESSPPRQTQPAFGQRAPEDSASVTPESEQLAKLTEAVVSLRQTVELLAMRSEAQNDSIQRALSELTKRIEDMDKPSGPSTFKAYGQD